MEVVVFVSVSVWHLGQIVIQDPVVAIFNKFELNSSTLHTFVDEDGDLPIIRVWSTSHSKFRAPSVKLSSDADGVAVRA